MATQINVLVRLAFLIATITLAFSGESPGLEIQSLKGASSLSVPLDRAVGRAFAVAAPTGIGTVLFDVGPFPRGHLSKFLRPPSSQLRPYGVESKGRGVESVLRQREWRVFGLERFTSLKKRQSLTMPSGSSSGSTPFYLDLAGLVPGRGGMVIQAKLIQQTRYANVYQEEGISVEPGFLNELISRIDNLIVPRDRLLFGKESDINGDGRFSILLTDRFKDSGAVGFFSAADLFPRRLLSNPFSNEQEILYATPVTGQVSRHLLYATIAHEYQHLINFSRRIYEIQDAVPEEVWLNEGLSYLAEDVCGLGDDINGPPAMAAAYLRSTPEASLTGPDIQGNMDTPEQRGAAYLFLRYFFERAGGVEGFETSGNLQDKGGAAFTRGLTSSGLAGQANVEKVTGMLFEEAFASWVGTLVADGMLGMKEGDFRYDAPRRDAITGQTVGIALRGERSVNCDSCRGQRAVITLDGPVYEPNPIGNWSVQGGSARYFEASSWPISEARMEFRGDSGMMAVYLMP